jgi:hypothetical protein
MSSQGPTGSAGYAYPLIRDAQDWTRRLKEQRLYTSYNAPGGDNNTDMSPPWLKFGNDIRLSYNQGRFSCAGVTGGCTGSAFSGVIPLAPAEGGEGFRTGTLQFLGGETPSYVKVSDKVGLNIQNSDFTVEWWMNMATGGPSFPRPFTYSYGTVGAGTQEFGVSIEGSDAPGGRTFYVWNGNESGFGNVSFTFPTGLYDSWHHFAIVGQGGNTITVYIDGATTPEQTFTSTNYYIAWNQDLTQTWNIGAFPQDEQQASVSFVGYMTNFRVVNGTAVYTAPFTKPSAPLTAIANSKLLFNSTTDPTAFTDTSLDFVETSVTVVGEPPPAWSSQVLF